MDLVSGALLARWVQKGGLEAPEELRGPDGDAFANEYFTSTFDRDFTAAAPSGDPFRYEAVMDHRVAENIVTRFREWQARKAEELQSFTFVLLKRGLRASEFSDEELERLQAQHLAHLNAMRERGVLVLAGPFSDQPDETLRGFCLYNTDIDETRRLAESDPSVQAGRMAVDVMGWWTKPGSLSR